MRPDPRLRRTGGLPGDQGRIAFDQFDGSDSEIFTIEPGGGQAQLTSGSVDGQPAFSPDSQRIAFEREVAVPGTFVEVIFTMAANGTGPAPVTPSDGSITSEAASFSPDGTRLTFQRCAVQGEACGDRISGKGGDDILCGGRGKDKLYGKKGDDVLIGGAHSDFLNAAGDWLSSQSTP